MNSAFASLLRTLPLPVKLLAAFIGLFGALVAAMGASRASPQTILGDAPFELTITRDAGSGLADELPCEVLPTVSFAMPVHLPASLRHRPPQPRPAAVRADQRDLDTQRFLRAIAEVESRGNPGRVGRLGERGLYQFRRNTWRQHTREHFTRAHHPGVATAVALRHYQWILRQLHAKGRQGTPYEIALAWNAGVTNVIAGRAPARAHAYAQRVVNLSGS